MNATVKTHTFLGLEYLLTDLAIHNQGQDGVEVRDW